MNHNKYIDTLLEAEEEKLAVVKNIEDQTKGHYKSGNIDNYIKFGFDHKQLIGQTIKVSSLDKYTPTMWFYADDKQGALIYFHPDWLEFKSSKLIKTDHNTRKAIIKKIRYGTISSYYNKPNKEYSHHSFGIWQADNIDKEIKVTKSEEYPPLWYYLPNPNDDNQRIYFHPDWITFIDDNEQLNLFPKD